MKLIILLNFFMVLTASALETCSRTAYMNYQKIIVDTSSRNKGEGLRFYLSKDAKALSYLDEYQEKNKPSATSTFFSSLGGTVVLSGLVYSSFTDDKNKSNSLIYGGLIIVGLNYFYTRVKQYNSEPYLEKAVREYNKRNNPKIFFSPTVTAGQTGIGVGAFQEF